MLISGRIIIPQFLKDYAGISTVVFAGIGTGCNLG